MDIKKKYRTSGGFVGELEHLAKSLTAADQACADQRSMVETPVLVFRRKRYSSTRHSIVPHRPTLDSHNTKEKHVHSRALAKYVAMALDI